MSGDETNTYEDHLVRRGIDWTWAFRLEPFDGTGAVASLVITGVGTFTMTLTIETIGQFKRTTYAITVVGAVTGTWAAGLHDYALTLTFPGGQALAYGHGKVNVL